MAHSPRSHRRDPKPRRSRASRRSRSKTLPPHASAPDDVLLVGRRRGRRAGKRSAVLIPTAVGLILITGAAIALRSGGDPGRAVTSANNGWHVALRQVPRPPTGHPVSVTTPEGDRYTMAVVRAGVAAAPLSGMPPPPTGEGYAFIDYVLTNELRRPVLLDFPPNVFLRRATVPPDFAGQCISQMGAPVNLCDLPGRSKVIGRLAGSPGLVRQEADTFLAAGGSYLVRAVANPPVDETLTEYDMALYVWQVRYTRDGIARLVPFPYEDQST